MSNHAKIDNEIERIYQALNRLALAAKVCARKMREDLDSVRKARAARKERKR